MRPIIKWPGGKKQLLNEIKKYIPENINTYYEPFIGGGAVLFGLEPDNAKMNDLNKELINVYKQVKNHSSQLIQLLQIHEKNHCKEYFYQIRELDRQDTYNQLDNIEKAARFIYLNKTCFNGLYRVNSKGQFNAPMGRYDHPHICDEKIIKELSQYLKTHKVKISNIDFEKFLKNAEKGDFVYLDPPYDPISETSNFTSYNKDGFTKDEQKRLKKVCDDLNRKGVKFLQSNSDSEFINELYKDYKIVKVKATRSINSKADGRGKINEVFIMNY